MRLFAWSDLHVDYDVNRRLVAGLSDHDHRSDLLLLAGDLSHDETLLCETLDVLRMKFGRVAFVPGNHDLWVSQNADEDSLQKLDRLEGRCRESGVETLPFYAEVDGVELRLVPLLSWYREPHEGPDSLYLPKPGEDPGLRGWADHRRIRWPEFAEHGAAADALPERRRVESTTPVVPTITFSHFLPRVELVFHDWERFRNERRTSGRDPHPTFNFTRVAGCRGIDRRLRRLDSKLHVYGHQHRNRDRKYEGVRYVSRCLGYPDERLASGLSLDQFLPLHVDLP